MSGQQPIVPFNALGRGVAAMRDELLETVSGVFDSGWFVMGPNHNAFETELAHFLGAGHAIGCANGTDALQLALRALGVASGDSVMTAANAGGYTTTAVNLIGATPVYADVDALSHLLTIETLAAALGRLPAKPKVIVVTHLYGAAADILEITSWAHGLGILVLEDCAQALGAWDGNHRVGSVGDIATTSFYPTKNLGALGDGGAVMTNDEMLAKKVKSLRQYGWTAKYEADTPGGTNSRLDELQAAILRRRLLTLDATNQRRQQIHSRYEKAAADSVQFVNSSSAGFVGHLAVIEVDSRDKVAAHFDSLGISTAIHYPIPDHRQQIARSSAAVWGLPNTEKLAGLVLSLPLFAELTEEEICRVEEALASVPSF